jgi:hypothetical protein
MPKAYYQKWIIIVLLITFARLNLKLEEPTLGKKIQSPTTIEYDNRKL